MPRRVLATGVKDSNLYRTRTNDISVWTDLGPETSGAREKKILQPPNNRGLFLTKFPKYGDFEIVSEIFNGILAKELGIRHVSYFPIQFQNRDGVTCPSFIDRRGGLEELWEMKDLICRHSRQVNLDKMFGRDDEVLQEHNLENIVLILETEFGKEVLPGFFQMIGFDALIGHGDRHWSNYGVVVSFHNNTPTAKFAPIYDTASGYLTEMDDRSQLEQMLREDLTQDTWYRPPANRKSKGLCKITLSGNIKCNHFDLLEHVLADSALKNYIKDVKVAFRNFDEGLPRAILKKFFPDLDPLRKQVIETILVARFRIGARILSI